MKCSAQHNCGVEQKRSHIVSSLIRRACLYLILGAETEQDRLVGSPFYQYLQAASF